ncbi:maleylpyruvate isomerase N-terminal domain-containing protein [Nocardia brevicatena]|uniref:maleylpyruvate isomerase N-terminal domain-containing protein n=1 Tax=Nocardia brevicatena TaxID=37327 RepID=UPI00030C9EBC|nr:maleylpyruvate isomerase N-terminal domain-containing protein [Nocardia brevicatena]
MDVRGLLAAERAGPIDLLRTLTDKQWEAPTLCGGRRVREAVGHMLHDTIPLSTHTAICVRPGSPRHRRSSGEALSSTNSRAMEYRSCGGATAEPDTSPTRPGRARPPAFDETENTPPGAGISE